MKELNLQNIRQQLDVMDAQLTELFEKRMELCREVAEYKIHTGKPVYDSAREKQKLEAVTALAHSDFTRKGTYELFSQIMTISADSSTAFWPLTARPWIWVLPWSRI